MLNTHVGMSKPAAGDAAAAADSPGAANPLAWFEQMMDHCYQYAVAAKAAGRPVVGILCEYTPRELIMAAGGVPVCLCGGSAKTIPAAEEHLPANLCPLIKSTFGYHLLQTIRSWKWPTWWWARRPATARRRCTS